MKPDHSYNHLLRYFMEVKGVSGSSVSPKTGSTGSRKRWQEDFERRGSAIKTNTDREVME
jgi:hypothetical protein